MPAIKYFESICCIGDIGKSTILRSSDVGTNGGDDEIENIHDFEPFC